MEPLLSREQAEDSNEVDQQQAEEEAASRLLEDDPESNQTGGEENEDTRDNGSSQETSLESPDGPTSRIRGTRRLLKLAAPQVMYLYIGCITLLVRLPFSLSIPHFVSTTLGALAQGQFDRARREILWLFILGKYNWFSLVSWPWP